MIHKLYSYTDPNDISLVSSILITAAIGNVPVELHNKDDAPAEISHHPLASIRNYDSRWPVALTPHGPLWQTNSIARYFASIGDTNLLGNSRYEEGLVNQWIDYVSNEVHLPVISLVYPIFGRLETSPQEKETARNTVLNVLHFLDSYFLNNTFLAGHTISLADICLFSSLLDLYVHVLDQSLTKKNGNVTRYFITLLHHRAFRNFIEENSITFKDKSIVGKLAELPEEAGEDYEETREITEEEEGGEGEEGAEEAEEAEEGEGEGESKSERRRRSNVLATRIAQNRVSTAIASIQNRPGSGKKLTERDLQEKAIASVYHSPSPTKEPPKKTKTGTHAVRAIQQPNRTTNTF